MFRLLASRDGPGHTREQTVDRDSLVGNVNSNDGQSKFDRSNGNANPNEGLGVLMRQVPLLICDCRLQTFVRRCMICGNKTGLEVNKDILKDRTKKFAVAVIVLTNDFVKSREADVIARQIIRSGTSVAANYRAACRARSKAEFIAKLGTVIEEADETVFWLELVIAARILLVQAVKPLLTEANELTAIMVASRKTAQGFKK